MHNPIKRSFAGTISLILMLFFLTACYASPERALYVNDFGYQYILPTNDWYESESSDTHLSMYGPEGKTDIQFLAVETTQQPGEILDNLLVEQFASTKNTVSELQHNGKTYLFVRLDSGDADQGRNPKYLAAFLFAENRVVIAKGCPDEKYESSFESIFRRVVFSLEPFTPPKPEALQ